MNASVSISISLYVIIMIIIWKRMNGWNSCFIYINVKLFGKQSNVFFCELCLQGAALIRMLANFMGHSVFQMGLQVCSKLSFHICRKYTFFGVHLCLNLCQCVFILSISANFWNLYYEMAISGKVGYHVPYNLQGYLSEKCKNIWCIWG